MATADELVEQKRNLQDQTDEAEQEKNRINEELEEKKQEIEDAQNDGNSDHDTINGIL